MGCGVSYKKSSAGGGTSAFILEDGTINPLSTAVIESIPLSSVADGTITNIDGTESIQFLGDEIYLESDTTTGTYIDIAPNIIEMFSSNGSGTAGSEFYLEETLIDLNIRVGSSNRTVVNATDNTLAPSTSFATDSVGTWIGGNGNTFNAGVINSVIGGGEGITAKTDYTLYSNQLGINQDGIAFEHIINTVTPTADRTVTIKDESGTLAYTSDLPVIQNAKFYETGNGATTTISVANTPVKVNATTTERTSTAGLTVTNGRIQNTSGASMELSVDVSFSARRLGGGGGSTDFSFYIALDDVVEPSTRMQRGFGGAEGSASTNDIITVPNNSYIELWVENNVNTNNIVVEDIHFKAIKTA